MIREKVPERFYVVWINYLAVISHSTFDRYIITVASCHHSVSWMQGTINLIVVSGMKSLLSLSLTLVVCEWTQQKFARAIRLAYLPITDKREFLKKNKKIKNSLIEYTKYNVTVASRSRYNEEEILPTLINSARLQSHIRASASCFRLKRQMLAYPCHYQRLVGIIVRFQRQIAQITFALQDQIIFTQGWWINYAD